MGSTAPKDDSEGGADERAGASHREPSPKELEKLPLEQVLKVLDASTGGLTDEEAQKRLSKYGPNEIPEKEQNPILKFLSYFVEPMSIAIEVAAILSAFLGRWDDFALIIALLLTNVVIAFWQERSAGNAVKALMSKLAVQARVLRDGKWTTVPAKLLVPGDVIRLRMGDVVPADARLLDGSYLSVDQSALTGESLPVSKEKGDAVYSSSLVRQGEMTAVVTGTGTRTMFGKTATLTSQAVKTSGMQKVISKVLYILVGFAVALDAIILVDGVVVHTPFLDSLLFSLILLVASIPIAMPVVLTVTMALGALELAKKNAIVTRFASIEELSVMDVLCSDKTGTLTQNKITVGEVIPYGSHDAREVLLYAALASKAENLDAIDQAIFAKAQEVGVTSQLSNYVQEEFVPFDPVRKRTQAKISVKQQAAVRVNGSESLSGAGGSGPTFWVTKGEPNTVISICGPQAKGALADVDRMAVKGNRVIAVATSRDNRVYELIGLVALFDPLREDARSTVEMARKLGVDMKMVTGDNAAIAREIGRQIGLEGEVLTHDQLGTADKQRIESARIFAQVYPEDKYAIVRALKGNGHTVGMTGDGVNDAPALKEAQVGIAVYGATDVAKNAADLVLSAPGLSVIVDAVMEGRRTFQKMLSYVLYRVTETLRILVFITAVILAWHFYPITALMLVLLALLNDLPIIAVSTDKVRPSNRPEIWDMKYVAGLSSMLGLMGAGETILLIYLSFLFHVSLVVIPTIVFLKLIVSGHFTMFVTRDRSAFWRHPPSFALFLALISTMVVGYFLGALGLGMAPIGWYVAALVVGYSFFWFLVEDGLRMVYDRVLAAVSKPKPRKPILPSANLPFHEVSPCSSQRTRCQAL
jgi:H+-transporting ATPase